MTLIEAIEDNDVDLVAELIEDEGADYNLRYEDEYPLLLSIKLEHDDITYYLLELDQIDLTVTDDDDNNALHLAVKADNYELVDYLSDYIDIDELNRYSESPLSIALHEGYDSIAQLLINKGAQLTYHDLFKSIEVSDRQFILDAYGEINDRDYLTLMDLSIGYLSGSFDMLIEYNPEQAERIIRNDKESRLLNKAIQFNDDETIVKLLKMGAGINNIDDLGNTPLHNAVIQEASLDIIKLLLEYGADKTIYDQAGKTADQVARMMGYKAVADFIKGFKLPTAIKSAKRH